MKANSAEMFKMLAKHGATTWLKCTVLLMVKYTIFSFIIIRKFIIENVGYLDRITGKDLITVNS